MTALRPYGPLFRKLRDILDELSPSDRAAVIAMGERKVCATSPLRRDPWAILEGVRGALRRRGTLREESAPRLWEALEQAIRVFSDPPAADRRPVILVWTHDLAKPDAGRSARMLAALLERNVRVIGCVAPAISPPRGDWVVSVAGRVLPIPGATSGWLPETGALNPFVEQTRCDSATAGLRNRHSA